MTDLLGAPGPATDGREQARIDDRLAFLYAWPGSVDGPGRPVVRANMVASLDGGIGVDGRSGGLGNDADERLFAVLRDLADVILVGSGTVAAEGYGGVRLDADRAARRVRWGLSETPPPIAVITHRGVGPGLSLTADAPLFTDTVTPPIVVTTRAAADRVPDGVDVIVAGADRVDLPAAVAALGERGLRRVHCEGGPRILGELVAADRLDELCLTLAPRMVGAGNGSLLGGVELPRPTDWAPTGPEGGVAVADGAVFLRYGRRR